jgi:hypothetical protein
LVFALVHDKRRHGDLRLFAPMSLERGKRAAFICAHKPAVAGDISREDGRQPPFSTRVSAMTIVPTQSGFQMSL